MLQFLKIRNLALLDEVELEFNSGFTAVTGETGAGKSILLGALALLSGSRTDKSIIKQGADSCEVEATFYFANSAKIDVALKKLNLPTCEDNTLVLARSIAQSKATRILINGAFAPLASLQALGSCWIDFHGPHEPQKLFHERFQLQMLDMYSGLSPLLREYFEEYAQWKAIKDKIEEIASQEQLSEDELEFIQTQLNRINAVNPTRENIEKLESLYTRITNAQEIGNLSAKIHQTLSGESGVTEILAPLVKLIHELNDICPETASLAERLNALIIETEDLACEFENLSSEPDIDQAKAQQVIERMNLWLEIQRKYGPSIEAVLNKKQQLTQKIENRGNVESTLAKLKKQEKEALGKLTLTASLLHKKRVEASHDLAKKTRVMLKKLGFAKADFSINLTVSDDIKETGHSRIAFLFAPNAGHDLLALNKIASSGESARVMLALKAILAQVDSTPVLVFDEVDANVGGEIGLAVAHELACLAKGHQVFCVTHLPQVASQANQHVLVTKNQTKNSTKVEIKELTSKEGKVNELARMLGDRNSASAKSHAQELLSMT